MKKLIFASIFTTICMNLFTINTVAAYNSPYSNFYSDKSYRETPGFTQFPEARTSQSSNTNYLKQNFDSSALDYDYRGPLYEKEIVYKDNLVIDKSSKSGFFYSKSNDILRHKITTKITEKYLGASESISINNQNRRTESSNTNQGLTTNYNGGFSW